MRSLTLISLFILSLSLFHIRLGWVYTYVIGITLEILYQSQSLYLEEIVYHLLSELNSMIIYPYSKVDLGFFLTSDSDIILDNSIQSHSSFLIGRWSTSSTVRVLLKYNPSISYSSSNILLISEGTILLQHLWDIAISCRY